MAWGRAYIARSGEARVAAGLGLGGRLGTWPAMVGFAEGEIDGGFAGGAQAATAKATRIAPRWDRRISMASLVVERAVWRRGVGTAWCRAHKGRRR